MSTVRLNKSSTNNFAKHYNAMNKWGMVFSLLILFSCTLGGSDENMREMFLQAMELQYKATKEKMVS